MDGGVGVPGALLCDRALFLEDDGGVLVVSDLHLGLDLELRRKGVALPLQTDRIRDGLLSLVREHGPERLIILGDVRHAIPTASRGEATHVPRILADLKKKTAIAIIPGNHDGGIADIVPAGIELLPARGTVIGDIGFFHGHTWPGEDTVGASALVCGHSHPSVTLTDESGHDYKLPCWVTADLDTRALAERLPDTTVRAGTLLVMPAFNPLITGTSFNGERVPLGPLFRNGIALPGTYSYTLLDGTHLGTLGPERT